MLTQEVPSTWAMHMQRAITTRGGAVGSSRSHRTILSALEAASVGSSDSCLQGQWRSPIGTHLADGRHVYTIGWDTVIALSRDPGTGALTQLEGVSGCLAVTERQACARASRMGSPQSLAMSPRWHGALRGLDGSVVIVNTEANGSVGAAQGFRHRRVE